MAGSEPIARLTCSVRSAWAACSVGLHELSATATASSELASSPDGQTFALNQPLADVSEEPITVVINWTEGLPE